MTHSVRLVAAILSVGLLAFAAPASAGDKDTLQKQLNRLMEGTADDMKARANEMSRILREQLESMMDANGNIVIQGPWPWQDEKDLKVQPQQEPFGGEEV
jgi:hypothetical protein